MWINVSIFGVRFNYMWQGLAGFILRNRLAILITLGVITIFMAIQVPKNEVSYDLTNLLPKADSTAYEFDKFKKDYGANDNVYLVATEDSSIFEIDQFLKLKAFVGKLQGMPAVDSIYGITNFKYLRKNKLERRFELADPLNREVKDQSDLDSVRWVMYNQPFYQNILYIEDKGVNLMAIILNSDSLFSVKRNQYVLGIASEIDNFSAESGIKFTYSGMPYIRAKLSSEVEDEIFLFLGLAALLTTIILYLFLKSHRAVLISLLVVLVAVIWSFGIVALMGYKITILISLIPPLVIVIGIPNCIFLLNRYYLEFRSHQNQAKSLSRVIRKTGNATLLTNATTAAGFATFALTPSLMLQQFGKVASLSILAVFVLSVLLIPTLFSYLKPPSKKHYKHLEKRWIQGLLGWFTNVALNYRGTIYLITIALAGLSGYGLSKLNNNAFIVDDIPDDHPVMVDLKYFESKFDGVVPFEIIISSDKKGKAIRSSTLEKVEELYQVLGEYEEFSKPVSMLDVFKYSKQAFYNGNPDEFRMPLRNEMGFIYDYASRSNSGSDNLLRAFMNEDKSELRISLQMVDVGTKRTKELMSALDKDINKIFKPSQFKHTYTGISVIVAKGVDMLVSNLIFTLLLAIGLISLLMAVMFRNIRMVIISIVPNLLPLLFTASIMGYFGINIKPSTILVFSIAFGISVDDTIHFLAKYRQELAFFNGNIKKAVIKALQETGLSMFYTSVVLFFGFGIFVTSNFGGTQALGLLVALTLLIAMLSNLILLPSLLLSLDKLITVKAASKKELEEAED